MFSDVSGTKCCLYDYVLHSISEQQNAFSRKRNGEKKFYMYTSVVNGYCISAKTCKQRIGKVVLFLQLLVQENLENLTDDTM